MASTTTMGMDMNSTMEHHHNSTMDHEHEHGGTVHMMHMMQMTFYMSSSVTILFEEWVTSSTAELVGSCAAVFVMAMLYEGLKVFREILLRNSVRRRAHSITPTPSVGGGSKDAIMFSTGESSSPIKTMLSADHALQSLLHMLQVTVSYFLMLIAMTFNGWLFIAVVLGAGAGYFLFSWKRVNVSDVNEHCH